MTDELMEPVEEFDFDRIYKLKVNGVELEAKLNGNNYRVEGSVSDGIVAEGDFIARLEIGDEAYENQKCVAKFVDKDDITHLIFDAVTPQEMRDMEKEAKIEYLSMMLDADWE